MQGSNQYLQTFIIAFAVVALAVFGVGLLLGQAGGQPVARAAATLHDASGAEVGQVTFSQDSNGQLTIDVRAHDLLAGFHGFHIHTTGVCDASGDKPFASAGGHFNEVADATHGHHSGDMPSLLVGDDGTAQMSFVTDHFKIADLLDSDGSAVIVHAGLDNFANIPDRYSPAADATTLSTGDAGGRIACAVILGG